MLTGTHFSLADMRSGGLERKEDIFIKPLLPRIMMDGVRQRLDRYALKKTKES